MRLELKKYLFIGHRSSLETFFEKAQESALVHFIDINNVKIKEIPAEIQNINSAIKIVKELPSLNQEEPENYKEIDTIVKKTIDLKHSIDLLEEERRILKLEIARIEVFGDFSLRDIEYIEKEGGLLVQFFFSKKGVKDTMDVSKELIYVGTKYDLDYFISLNTERVKYENMIEMKIDHEVSALKQRVKEIEQEIKENEQRLKVYAKYNVFFHHEIIRKYNHLNLATAKNFARQTFEGKLFSIEGWVPKHKLQELEKAIKELDVQILEIAIEEGEVPPTYLENRGLGKLGEDLVHIYDTPSNTDKDPSLWVLVSFALFFSMIINDGGYGLVFLAAALYIKFKNPNMRKKGARLWKLAAMLCAFCIAWGTLTNSFFGISLNPEHGLRKASLLNYLVEKKAAYIFEKKDAAYQQWAAKFPELEKADTPQQFLRGAAKKSNGSVTYEMMNELSDSILLELALLVGMVHICLSFARYLGRNWQGIGWIIAIIGCYFYFPQFLKATTIMQYLFGFDRDQLAAQGFYLIWIGYGLAVFLGIVKNKLLGLLEIMNSIQIFSDVISYLRIYALGLAGSIIGTTLNDIAGSIFFLGGVLLFIIGHGINMALSIVGGIIHGLRLNFIEWYHYSFEGGGKLFDPLRKIEIE
jgi:V/A-type H+-transporting ATPase subunit I